MAADSAMNRHESTAGTPTNGRTTSATIDEPAMISEVSRTGSPADDFSSAFLRGVNAALQNETSLRIGRQLCVIVGTGRTEVSLGIDVHANGFQDVIAIQRSQKRQGGELMQIVDASQRRRLALVVQ